MYIAAGIAACLIFLLSRFRLAKVGDVLFYRSLTGIRNIELSHIDRALIETISRGRGGYQQLSIYPRENPQQAVIRINIKVFSRDDLRRLFDALGPRLKSPREIGIYVEEKI